MRTETNNLLQSLESVERNTAQALRFARELRTQDEQREAAQTEKEKPVEGKWRLSEKAVPGDGAYYYLLTDKEVGALSNRVLYVDKNEAQYLCALLNSADAVAAERDHLREYKRLLEEGFPLIAEHVRDAHSHAALAKSQPAPAQPEKPPQTLEERVADHDARLAKLECKLKDGEYFLIVHPADKITL